MPEREPEHELFGTKNGDMAVTGADRGKLTCDLCGITRNPELDYDEEPDALGDQWSRELRLRHLQILDCCFPKIEQLFLYLATLPNALPWLLEQLQERGDEIRAELARNKNQIMLAELVEELLGRVQQ